MKKLNRVYLYPVLIIVVLLVLVFIISFKKSIETNNIMVIKNSINETIDYYSDNSKLTTHTYREIESETILDFDVNIHSTVTEENSSVEFYFSNNKLSFLLDAIITSKDDSIEKYDYINYFEAEHLKNNLNLSEKILNNISYLSIVDLDFEYYDFNNYSSDEIIKKYFLVSYLKNIGYKEVEVIENRIFEDLKNNFLLYDDETKLKLFLFLFFSGELDNFLDKVDFDLVEITNKDNGYYIYLSNKLKLEDDLSKVTEKLYGDFSSLSDLEKVLFIGYLNEIESDDFEEYYLSFEKKSNYDIELETAFIKYLIYSKFDNEYTSFDNSSKFWYSSGILINRKQEFILNRDNTSHIDLLSLDRVIYDGLIDTRVVSFEGDRIYLNVIVKEN